MIGLVVRHPLSLRSDPVRFAATWREQRNRFLAILAAADEPLDGEVIARLAGETGQNVTASYRLASLRRLGYVEHAGLDRYGRVLWRITRAGRTLLARL